MNTANRIIAFLKSYLDQGADLVHFGALMPGRLRSPLQPGENPDSEETLGCAVRAEFAQSQKDKVEQSFNRTHCTKWRIQDAGPNSGNVIRFEIVDARDGSQICEIEDPELDGKSPRKRNAAEARVKLIAASPVLRDIVRDFVRGCEQGEAVGEAYFSRLLDDARAAVRLATEGES